MEWTAIPVRTLNIAASLDSGQCFRWQRAANGDWLGVIADSAVRLRATETGFWWQTYPTPGRWDLLHRYFALEVDLLPLYAAWEEQEPRIAPSLAQYAGMRILRQDAGEVFFSFLCATCNTMVKIRRSVNALAARYGDPLYELEGRTLYRFPTASQIASASDADLRTDLWGFRAPRLLEAARQVATQSPSGEEWLASLREKPYSETHATLMEFNGIGAKVADCMCLFAFWQDAACPIDTHVRQIAVRLYRPDLASRSLTPAVYDALADEFRRRFGPYAGWAQQYLFYDKVESSVQSREKQWRCS